LIDELLAFYRQGIATAAEAARYLNQACNHLEQASLSGLVEPTTTAAARYLSQAVELGRDTPTARLAAALESADLAWRPSYPELAGNAEFDAFIGGYSYAQIAGPDGPLMTNAISIFATIQAPGLLYPPHHHAATEVYVAVGGRAEWQRDTEPWRRRNPGSIILHTSDMPHAARTHDEPLLAIAVWLDNLEGPSRMV